VRHRAPLEAFYRATSVFFGVAMLTVFLTQHVI